MCVWDEPFKRSDILGSQTNFLPCSVFQPKVKDFGIDPENMFEFWDVSVGVRWGPWAIFAVT